MITLLVSVQVYLLTPLFFIYSGPSSFGAEILSPADRLTDLTLSRTRFHYHSSL